VIESFRRAAAACDADEAQLEILRANAVQHPSRAPEPWWKRVFARRTTWELSRSVDDRRLDPFRRSEGVMARGVNRPKRQM
jgi:hypothetical protein